MRSRCLYFTKVTKGYNIFQQLGSTGGAVDERSPPTSVTRVDTRTRLLMWVEFVVGSRLALRVFLRDFQFSSLHKNQHF